MYDWIQMLCSLSCALNKTKSQHGYGWFTQIRLFSSCFNTHSCLQIKNIVTTRLIKCWGTVCESEMKIDLCQNGFLQISFKQWLAYVFASLFHILYYWSGEKYQHSFQKKFLLIMWLRKKGCEWIYNTGGVWGSCGPGVKTFDPCRVSGRFSIPPLTKSQGESAVVFQKVPPRPLNGNGVEGWRRNL